MVAAAATVKPAPRHRSAFWTAYGAATVLGTSGLGLGINGAPARAAAEAPAAVLNIAVDQGGLSVALHEAPLAEVLRAIGERAGFSVIIDGNLDDPTTQSFTGVSVEEAVRRLVGDASWVMLYNPFFKDGTKARTPAELRVYKLSTAEPRAGVRAPILRDPARSYAHIVIGLTDPEPRNRLRAVRKLAVEKAADGARLLADVLAEDKEPVVRQQAAAALAKFPGEDAGTALSAALANGDPDPNVRRQAARSLQALHEDGTRWALDAAQSDPDPTVREVATTALAKW